ncbi:MAG: hypothetical protein MJZ71_02055 [Bacteroidales bacterium]|nr:hypothetical protein [Bacteroidales bacterium]
MEDNSKKYLSKYTIKRSEDGRLYLERLVYPRFRVYISFEDIENLDNVEDDKLLNVLKKGKIWLAKISYKNRGLMITNKKLKEQLKSLIYKVNRNNYWK